MIYLNSTNEKIETLRIDGQTGLKHPAIYQLKEMSLNISRLKLNQLERYMNSKINYRLFLLITDITDQNKHDQ